MGRNKKSRRALGDVLLDMEPFLFEAMKDHGLQWGDMLALIHVWLTVHCPEDQEQYTAGGSPEFYYGHRRGHVKNED